MMSDFGGAFTMMPPVLAQLFTDIGGFLFGPEILGALAALLIALLTNLFSSLFGGP